MWFLLGTTLTASFFDSLNPSAIAQQMDSNCQKRSAIFGFLFVALEQQI